MKNSFLIALGLMILFQVRGQPVRFMYSDAVTDTVHYFTPILKRLISEGKIDTTERTDEKFVFWSDLERNRIRLLLFEEPVIEEAESVMLRVCYFPCHDVSRIVRIENSPNGYRAVCKTEADNSYKLSYFNQKKLTSREISKLRREIKKMGEEVWPTYKSDIFKKSAITDSLKFRFQMSEFVLDSSLFRRNLDLMTYLKIGELDPFISENMEMYNRSHFCAPDWILEWRENGQYKVIKRSNPSFELESLLHEFFRFCDGSN
ncbi:hypothetical protein [Imperialibacter roseus]|uniref:Uncharacterized protein n=1 Tax=Imperialibacter roseus TaxID=1324217 RepID=A0ABZ0IKX1_9BACT|nr:hypothetical protein [Imperialibacter roseus]WOK05672.1 hypothetical protein RT717_21590 [Imperialibacter roseus]|tara:strand:- start:19932 stop:20714 length:783 start_codon:yes stop_codon:yes gene_type:complete